jgi:hypothetical protein
VPNPSKSIFAGSNSIAYLLTRLSFLHWVYKWNPLKGFVYTKTDAFRLQFVALPNIFVLGLFSVTDRHCPHQSLLKLIWLSITFFVIGPGVSNVLDSGTIPERLANQLLASDPDRIWTWRRGWIPKSQFPLLLLVSSYRRSTSRAWASSVEFFFAMGLVFDHPLHYSH